MRRGAGGAYTRNNRSVKEKVSLYVGFLYTERPIDGEIRYFKASVKNYNEMACRQLKYPCISEKE